jgi:hypothetical protein
MDQILTLLSNPLLDSDTPDGFVRREFAEAEMDRRKAQVTAVIERLTDTIRLRYGEHAAAAARRHFEPVLRELAPPDTAT